MGIEGEGKPDVTIAIVDGKTTPFGFDIKLFQSIPRNTFLSTFHEDKNYVLLVNSLWNSEKGAFARVQVVGNVPLTPFAMDSKILLADEEQIANALGLHLDPQKSLSIGKIIHTDIEANINVEKMGRVFITGRSGTGKSYTVGVLIEELMKKRIPLVIIDRHGEYSSLKFLEKNNIPGDEPFFDKNDPDKKYAESLIEFGDTEISPWVDLDIEYLLASQMKQIIVPGHVLIINLRGLDLPVQENIIDQLCARLYKASTLGEIPPHYIFIDEAHLFAGKKKKGVKETLKLLAQEGRKFGSNLVIITQKPQALDTTIRAQAGTWIIHKLTDINDVKITCNSAEGLGNDAQEEIQNLAPGEAIITGDIAPNCPLMVKVRLRYTVHGGAGYNVLENLEDGEKIPKAKLVQELLKNISSELREDMGKEVLTTQKVTTPELHHRVDKLLRENVELKQKIQDLQTEKGKSEEISSQTVIVSHTQENNKEKEDNPDIKKIEEERDSLEAEVQTLQLEISGMKVEVNDIKDKYKAEQKRADDAVSLAEKLMEKIKTLSKKK